MILFTHDALTLTIISDIEEWGIEWRIGPQINPPEKSNFCTLEAILN